jgi:hypothetical protein
MSVLLLRGCIAFGDFVSYALLLLLILHHWFITIIIIHIDGTWEIVSRIAAISTCNSIIILTRRRRKRRSVMMRTK